MGDISAEIFQKILLVCDEIGLIGYTHFPLYGVKLPSDAFREGAFNRFSKYPIELVNRHLSFANPSKANRIH